MRTAAADEQSLSESGDGPRRRCVCAPIWRDNSAASAEKGKKKEMKPAAAICYDCLICRGGTQRAPGQAGGHLRPTALPAPPSSLRKTNKPSFFGRARNQLELNGSSHLLFKILGMGERAGPSNHLPTAPGEGGMGEGRWRQIGRCVGDKARVNWGDPVARTNKP